MDEDLPKEEEEEGVKKEEGVGERAWGALTEGIGEKRGRVLDGEVNPSSDMGVGEEAETTLNGEEQGGARPEEGTEGKGEEEEGKARTGEGERCLMLGLKAEGGRMKSLFWSEGGTARLCFFPWMDISWEGLEEGWLAERRLGSGSVVRPPGSCWFGSLEMTETQEKKDFCKKNNLCDNSIFTDNTPKNDRMKIGQKFQYNPFTP